MLQTLPRCTWPRRYLLLARSAAQPHRFRFVTGTTYGSTEAADRLIKLVGHPGHPGCSAPPPRPALLSRRPDLITWVHVDRGVELPAGAPTVHRRSRVGDQADRYSTDWPPSPKRLGGGHPRGLGSAYFRHVGPAHRAGEQALGAIDPDPTMRGRGTNPVIPRQPGRDPVRHRPAEQAYLSRPG